MSSSRITSAARQFGSQTTRAFSSKLDKNVNVLSGIPERHAARRVRIYRPTKYVRSESNKLSLPAFSEWCCTPASSLRTPSSLTPQLALLSPPPPS